MTPIETVQTFLDHLFSGRRTDALALIDEDCRLIASRPQPDDATALYGVHVGPAGAAELFQRFDELLEPGQFDVDARFSDGEHVAMYGALRHRGRATGLEFASDWALICRVREGKLMLYHFYEDTAALEAAICGCRQTSPQPRGGFPESVPERQ
ncbi:nuclear transport factor 2 family protein [Burkholderia sp. D-99]|uniref:nuclear transport factor 2 family protein n=1 Tax=Burkholderia sp. D-99 TaxID=2717316 RepID=UPI00141E1463|nr:nuclear transport factor 2 family protein [Burkholderia sp. D-99]NHV26855.1 SnoaL-like domain-containing protein [Burkholderia sp. D-99]